MSKLELLLREHLIFAMPQIVAGIKSFFGAIADGLALIISVFRKK